MAGTIVRASIVTGKFEGECSENRESVSGRIAKAIGLWK